MEKHINTLYLKMVEAVYGKQEPLDEKAGVIHVLNGILENEVCSIGTADFTFE